MPFKFEKLEVRKLALDYMDLLYAIADELPEVEKFNLKSQMHRAGTSIALNIAEGSIGQTDSEQARFLGFSIRSLVESVACQLLIRRRGYPISDGKLDRAYEMAQVLVAKLHSMRKAVAPKHGAIREDSVEYEVKEEQGCKQGTPSRGQGL